MSVDGLDGAPGIYSARWAGPDKNFAFAMARVERELRAGESQPACALYLCAGFGLARWPCATHFTGEIWQRHLVFPPRGDKGFGYDPIFIADGYNQTFGEMTPTPSTPSATARCAFRQLVAACFPMSRHAAVPGRRRLRPLCALAVLHFQMPLLRFQQPCGDVDVDQAAWRDALLRELAYFAARNARPYPHQHFLRRRHAVADGRADDRGRDRRRGAEALAAGGRRRNHP